MTKQILNGFEDDYGRLTPQAFVKINGELHLVCAGADGDGFVLYSRDEWNATAPAEYEADIEGNVRRLGNYTGQQIPQSAMDSAIS